MHALLLLLLTCQQEIPHATITLNDGARLTTGRTVTARVTCTGEPSLVSFSLDGETWSRWRNFEPVIQIELPPGDGPKTIRAKICDRHAVASDIATATIILDTTPPTAALARPPILFDGGTLLAPDVPDAVALQVATGEEWSRWLPYASPIAAPGKPARIRFRDAAGHVSDPLALEGTEGPPPALRDIRILRAHVAGETLVLSVVVLADGAESMTLAIDDGPASTAQPFTSTFEARIPRDAVSHKLLLAITFRDGALSTAALAFQEEDVTLEPPNDPPLSSEEPGRVSARASVGLWFDGLDFDAVAASGRRTLDSGQIGLLQLDVQFVLWRPVFVGAWLEFAEGGDISILSGGLDVGLTFPIAPSSGSDLRLDVFIGPFGSRLDISLSGFESFDPGFGLRLGALLHTSLSPRLRLEAGVEGRLVRYPWSGDAVSGDSEATANGAALILGATWRF